MASNDPQLADISQALASCPSQFAQLLLLASMRDPYSGLYRSLGLDDALSPESNAAMKAVHQTLFETVSSFTLIALAEELRDYFALCGEAETRAVQFWMDTEPYQQIIPEGCPSLPRKYFISQVHLALNILARAPDWRHLKRPRVAVSRQGTLASAGRWSGLADIPPFKM